MSRVQEDKLYYNTVTEYLHKVLLKGYNNRWSNLVTFYGVAISISLLFLTFVCAFFEANFLFGIFSILCLASVVSSITYIPSRIDVYEHGYILQETEIRGKWHKLKPIRNSELSNILLKTISEGTIEKIFQDPLNLIDSYFQEIDKMDLDYPERKVEWDNMIEVTNQKITFAFYEAQADINEKIKLAKSLKQ